MEKLFYFIFLLSSISALSQKKIIDTLSKEPISFSEMYSEKGEILGTTNYYGEISEEELLKIKNLNIKEIYFHHNNYQSKHISYQELSNLNTIYLLPSQIDKINNLDEVIVLSNIKKKYKKLTAYFRSIQYNNNQPQYYMDGIVEYYISLKNGKIKFNILQNRSLKDNNIKQIDEKGLIRLNFNLAGVLNLSDFVDFKKLESEYTIQQKDNSFSIAKENLEIGKIITNNNNTFLNMEIYSEKNPKIMKLFGTESILKNYTVNAIYEKNEDVNKLKNVEYIKEYREYKIKQRKDLEYTSINVINEIYIIDKAFTDTKSQSGNPYFTFITESNYKEDFWINILKNNYITPVPETVELFIEKKLSESK